MKLFDNQELRDITESDIQKIIEIVRVLEKKDSAHIMARYNNYNFSNNYVLGDYSTKEKTVKALFFPNTELKEGLKDFHNFSVVKTENCGGYVRYYLLYTYDVICKEKIVKTIEECEVLDILDYYNYDERKVYNDYQSNVKEYQAQLNTLNSVRLNLKKDGSERKDKLKNIIYNLDGVNNDKFARSPFLEYNQENKCRIVFESFGNNNYFTFEKSIDELTLTEILEEIEKDKKRLEENIKDYEERKKTIKKDVAAYLEARKKLDEFGRIRYILGR